MIAVVRFKSVEENRLLTGMLVVPEFRSQGLAHQLMSYCEQHVLQRGFLFLPIQNLKAFISSMVCHALFGSLPNTLRGLFERYSQKNH